ncbi:hypothetical protein R69746_08358 [Paraburkholderia aspalathi]|uniref:hypothetical protein n=1 Tax=Paraburkholderia aspalathi TaxID=1324617 RepID=UPI00190CD71C|nr:hypothetical protein [Paraburkholderia aspalathi]MBK3844267.1 hypothetical protein [Paraburkholderia aspalathi]CAE6870172.1 hypothetical protein R69746_08358 [Paraburkholderia aspalathi]
MEIVDIFVEYPSGMSIADRATLIQQLETVAPSERLAAILRELAASEAPPAVTAMIGDVSVRLDARVDGTFSVSRESASSKKSRSGFRLFNLGHSWSKDQRQQFGRFAHTLSAASAAGAIGYGHSTTVWTLAAVFNVSALVVLFVVLFLIGMDSMNGE